MKPTVVHGQSSFRVASDTIEAFVTREAGMLAPVTFDVGGKKIMPYSIAPWAENGEAIDKGLPPLLHALRGDFFCLPFGGNDSSYRGEQHPPHGETANAKWTSAALSEKDGVHDLRLSLKMKTRAGKVSKMIRLIDGHQAVYQRHTVTGMSGAMTPGHHAMLRLPDSPECGRISTSSLQYGQVLPFPFEDAEIGGYHALKPDAPFKSLSKVPLHCGGSADLTRYPARRGYDDLAMVVNKPSGPFGWTAVTFPKERYVYFALKDQQVLKNTILWMSNGGRHYAPWNGRHTNVLGIEDVTSYYHIGLAESVKANALSKMGYPTHVKLNAKKPFVVNYIMGMAPIPAGFDRVKKIVPGNDGTIELTADNGQQVSARVDSSFLRG
jgi:hypothetical protein